jgi:hypothetical protein
MIVLNTCSPTAGMCYHVCRTKKRGDKGCNKTDYITTGGKRTIYSSESFQTVPARPSSKGRICDSV